MYLESTVRVKRGQGGQESIERGPTHALGSPEGLLQASGRKLAGGSFGLPPGLCVSRKLAREPEVRTPARLLGRWAMCLLPQEFFGSVLFAFQTFRYFVFPGDSCCCVCSPLWSHSVPAVSEACSAAQRVSLLVASAGASRRPRTCC